MTLHQPPDPGVSNLDGLIAVVRTVKNGEINEDVPGLRINALSEAVFLIHKGLHVLRAAQAHALDGMPSWALFSSYHSAYLAGKGLLMLLGVAVAQPEGRQIFVDLFPQDKPRHVRKRGALVTGDFSTFKVIVPSGQFDQRFFWELFQRVIRLSRVDVWDETIKSNVLDLDWEEISPPRNRFIYSSGFWPFRDLHERIDAGPLLRSIHQRTLDVGDVDFLLGMACSVAVLAEALLFDLAREAPQLANEVTRGGYKSEEWQLVNPLYQQFAATHELGR